MSEQAALQDQVTHLEQAVGTRRVVGQAQGILMERHGLTPEQALGQLRASSRQTGWGLHHTAEQLIQTRAEPAGALPWGRSSRSGPSVAAPLPTGSEPPSV